MILLGKLGRLIAGNIVSVSYPYFDSRKVCNTKDRVNKWVVEFTYSNLGQTEAHFDEESEANKFYNDVQDEIKNRNENNKQKNCKQKV